MLLAEVVAASSAVAATASRSAKVATVAAALVNAQDDVEVVA